MNNKQLQVLGKILLLIATSGKGQLSGPGTNQSEYQPGISANDFHVVTGADIKKAQPLLSKIRSDLLKIFQQAPPSKLSSPEDRKKFFTESQAFLGQHIGPWSKDLPEWWFQVYSIGLHIKTLTSDFKKFTLYPSKILFNAIVRTLSPLGQGTTLLSLVRLDANLQMPLLNVLLEAAVPPSLLAELIVLETDIEIQKKCIERIIGFLREQTLKFLSPLYEYHAPCFADASQWADVFGTVTSMYSCYFQTEASDIYAEKKVSVTLGSLANELLAAMAMSDKAKTIHAFLAIKAYYQGLPERLQSMKLYLGPMALYREFYMPLYASAESGLRPDFKWYLAHLVPGHPTEHDVGFVVGKGALNYAHKQLEQENFELIMQTISSMPECAQPLAYFDLLQKLLSFPQKLIAFANYYREQNNVPLLKSFYLKLASAAKIQEAANAGWLGANFNQAEVLSLEIFAGFLDADDKMETIQLQAFLLKGFEYFQYHQAAGILWFTWLKSCIGDEALLTASKQLGNAEAEKWFSQRFIFQENPGQAGLVDEALAVNLFFSAEFMILVKQGDSKKVEPLIKSLQPSLPKISERVALHMITLCPNFSMAKTVIGELLELQTDEALCIRILLHALYTNQPNILRTYREMTDKETLNKYLTSQNFLEEFSGILYFTANHILDIRTHQLPESFRVLSEMLTEEAPGFDLPPEQALLFQHMMRFMSLKSKLLEPIMVRFFYLIKGKLNFLTKDEQKQFEQYGYAPTMQQLSHYLHLSHRLINLEEQDVPLAEKIAKGIYHTWVNVDRTDRTQVRRFLLMLVDLINCINGLVPKTTSPVVKHSTDDERTKNNYLTLSTLIRCLFYQIHARGFDDEVSIIGRLQDKRLRRDFVSAHIVRLILCEQMDAVKKMQRHFKTQINYSVTMNLFLKIEDSLNGTDEERFLYFQSRRIFPLAITVGDSLEFPFKQIDNLSVTLEVISETGKFLGENIRELMSVTLKNQIDHCSEMSALTQSAQLFVIKHSLINELILKADLGCIQLAFESFDCDQDLETAKEAINTALMRCSINTEIEKRAALKIMKLLLNVIRDGWDYFASQGIMDTRNGNMISIIRLIKEANIELFGLLYNYFVVEVLKPDEEAPAIVIPELKPISKEQTKEVNFEKMVEASYLKNKSATTTISLARMKSIVEKIGVRSEGDIDKFIRGYLNQADNSTALNNIGAFAKPNDQVPQITTLLNASYFKGTRFVQAINHFYPVRKSPIESYLYFNSVDIEDLKNPAPFQSLCEKLRFVGRSGAGLKYISNLRIQVEEYEIEGGFEMKIHGSKERIVCYLAPSDHPDNPNVYVACLYLEDGLHGRVDPNKPIIIPNKPNFGMGMNVEAPVANFHM